MTTLREYLERPKPPPDNDSTRMALKRAMDAGKPVRQEKFNYYYWYGWFERLGTKWTIHDIYVYLALNLSRKDREFRGRDQDPVVLREAAGYLRVLGNKAIEASEGLITRAERLERKDAETEATD